MGDGGPLHEFRERNRLRLQALFLKGLKTNIERDTKAGESNPTDASQKRKLDREREVLGLFEQGRYSLEPKVILGRDDQKNLGALLRLLLFGTDAFVESHPASIGLTGVESEDADLREAIVTDLTTAIGEHDIELEHVVGHVLSGCPTCTWVDVLRGLARANQRQTRELKSAEEEQKRLAELEARSASEAQDLRKNAEALRLEVQGKDAEVSRLKEEWAALSEQFEAANRKVAKFENALREHPAVKALAEIAQVDNYCKDALVHQAYDKIVSQMKAYREFYRREHRAVDLRKEAEGSLSGSDGERRKRLVHEDRVSLRDKGYPKFANRDDLVKMLWPTSPEVVENLLGYRADWDKRLRGHRISQKVFDRFNEGIDRWVEEACLTSLNELADKADIDVKTLRSYFRLGIAPKLARWFVTSRPPGPTRHETRLT